MSGFETVTPMPLELVFKEIDGLEISMDVYLPSKATKENPAPVVLWWHGGGLLQGTRKAVAPHLLAAPSKYNICVVAADYRLAPQTRFPGILEDCKSAVDFVRSSPLFESATNNRVDSSKLIVSGSSAGGWLSLLAGTGIGYSACGLERPVGISGVAAIYPITDLLDPFWTTKQHPVSYKGYMIGRKEVEPFIDPQDTKTASSPIGGKRDTFYSYMIQEAILGSLLLDGTNIPESEFSVAANLKYMATIPTMYIIHGNGDDKVPHRQSTDVVNVLKVVGAQVEYHEPDGLDHSFDDDPNCDMGSMYEFISRVF